MVMVKISETYDLSTKLNKMGLVGIHTPSGGLIDKMWSGLVLQHKKFRFVKCDVAMACASMLPADPLQVGVEAGAIAPQDMFNPILYRAVSNDSMNNILSLLAFSEISSAITPAYDKGSIVSLNDVDFQSADGLTTDTDQFSMYYSLLSDEKGWARAMPQAGLVMKNLYPLVYQVVSQYGQGSLVAGSPREGMNFVGATAGTEGQVISKDGTIGSDQTDFSYRGPPMRMPSIPIQYYNSTPDADVVPIARAYVSSNTGKVPPAYVACLVLPPAKLNQLYYRLKVTWTIEFIGLRAFSDIASWASLYYIGQDAYGTDYAQQSASMDTKLSMVDTSGATLEKVMEGV